MELFEHTQIHGTPGREPASATSAPKASPKFTGLMTTADVAVGGLSGANGGELSVAGDLHPGEQDGTRQTVVKIMAGAKTTPDSTTNDGTQFYFGVNGKIWYKVDAGAWTQLAPAP